ncbi:hypothetical protein F4775DRAFT_574398 [Biscogniauxia sp. FL1348]|nr:hypothetical protein F4775DRAFT_574398 [Biscogniauxia sp. FL1348]
MPDMPIPNLTILFASLLALAWWFCPRRSSMTGQVDKTGSYRRPVKEPTVRVWWTIRPLPLLGVSLVVKCVDTTPCISTSHWP